VPAASLRLTSIVASAVEPDTVTVIFQIPGGSEATKAELRKSQSRGTKSWLWILKDFPATRYLHGRHGTDFNASRLAKRMRSNF